MRKLLANCLALLLGVTGLGVVHAAAPDARLWEIGPFIRGQNKSVGMPVTMAQSHDGAYFDFPYPSARAGHVHYVTVPVRSLEGAKRITLRYRIDADRRTRFVPQDSPKQTATLSLYFQQRGDRWTAKYPTHRWYSPGNRVVSLEPGVHELSISLDENWIGVTGGNTAHNNPRAFARAIANAHRVGFVFGSNGGRGHGVYSTAPARFTMLDFEIE